MRKIVYFAVIPVCLGWNISSEAKDIPAKIKVVSSSSAQSVPPAAPVQEKTPSKPSGGKKDLVAALCVQVNNESLTVEEILEPMAEQLRQLASKLPKKEFARRIKPKIQSAMRRRVSEILVYSQANREMTEQGKQVLAMTVLRIRENLINQLGDGSETVAKRKLAQEGLTLDEAVQRRRRGMIVRQFLRARFDHRVHVSRQEMLRYYRKHLDRWQQPERRELLLISVEKDRFPDPSDARKHVKTARKAIESGTTFPEAAKKFSHYKTENGGSRGMIRRGSWRNRKVEDLLYSLDPGTISDPVETDRFTYLVAVGKIEPARTIPFETAQAEIEPALREERFQLISGRYMLKLYDEASVRTPPKFLDRAIQLAQKRFY